MDILDQLDKISQPTIEKKSWMNDVEFFLGTVEMLDQIEKECLASGRAGLDLETTGLDQRAFPNDLGQLVTVDKIVGFCIAPTTSRGFYIPVRHRGKGSHANVPVRLVTAMITRIQEAGVVFVFHNAKFDQKFLKCEPSGQAGDFSSPKSWEDTWILAYLRNPRDKKKGLKHLSNTLLKREMIELNELFPRERGKKVHPDFSLLDPTWEPAVWYAASDAINTLAVYEILHPIVVEKDKHGWTQRTVYTIEKICMTSTMWMEQCRIHIDRDRLTELIQLGQREWWECVQTVYSDVSQAVGRDIRPGWVHEMDKEFDPDVLSPDYMEVRAQAMRYAVADNRPKIPRSVPSLKNPKVRETVHFPPSYDITIPAQFGLMLRECGVRGLQVTEKSGQVKTDKITLESVLEQAGDQFPWMSKVRRFREITKALGNVLFNVYRDTDPSRSPDGCVWANFNGFKVDTGRFSTPSPRDKNHFHGQVNWNVQSTKAFYYNPKDPPPECVYRQREVISAREGYVLFAIDYSGVELRIATNLSGEPKWKAEFFRCSTCEHEFERDVLPPPFCPECGSDKIGDLHSLTAIGIYPDVDPSDAKVFKLKRQIGKIVNFLLCYGGSGIAVSRSTGVDEDEGWRIKNMFDKTYRGLLRWWESQHRVAKVQGYVTTVFGRKYPVPDINHEYNKWRSKAKRNAVNGPVQGSSADIMKFSMGLLYREFKKRGWIERGPGLPDLAMMVITIHDELVFEIHESVVPEVLPVIEHIMCRESVKNLNWEVPLKVDIEFGYNWTVPLNLIEMSYNKGDAHKDWNAHWARVFPDHYQHYLSCGGIPLDAVSSLPSTAPEGLPEGEAPKGLPEGEAPETLVAPAAVPEKKEGPKPGSSIEAFSEGDTLVYTLYRHRLSPSTAEKLARVLSKTIGRGIDKLVIRDEAGTDLFGETLRVAWGEFRVIAEQEGL